MNGVNQKVLNQYLNSRHNSLVSGLLLVFAAALVPLFISHIAGVDLSATIAIGSKWFGGGYLDCTSYSRELMLSILSVQISALLLAFGAAVLFSYMYSEYKFREVIKFLKLANAKVPFDL